MHTVAQIIEELQINNLPHLPNGDFIITEKLQQSILSLLSQQAVVEQTDEEWIKAGARELFMLHNHDREPDPENYMDSRLLNGFEKDLRHLLVSAPNHFMQQLSKEQESETKNINEAYVQGLSDGHRQAMETYNRLFKEKYAPETNK